LCLGAKRASEQGTSPAGSAASLRLAVRSAGERRDWAYAIPALGRGLMQNSNVREYESIRSEMNNLKDCITKYIGYAFAGSGAMIYGLARIKRSSTGSIAPEIAFIAAAFSMLLSLILLVIFYKFNSHNRFAGYCKMLNHEHHEPLSEESKKTIAETSQKDKPQTIAGEPDKIPDVFSWEVSVGDLRWLESTPENLGHVLKNIEISEPTKTELRPEVEKCLGKQPSIDDDKYLRGLGILIKTLFLKNIRTYSWGFPPLVVIIFLFLTSGFLLSSWFVTYKIGLITNISLLVFEAAVTVFQLLLWIHLFGRLFLLMNGSATVYSFFWKFIPIRALFLNKFGIKPSYISIQDYVFSKTSRP
jgi:hypothetical protein